MELSRKAWKILTDQEKTALTLSMGHSKSSWQAGEIMGKSHYKYLEIKARGEKFVKLFTEYYEMYDSLIPINSNISPDFITYIRLSIEDRKSIKQAITEIGSLEYQKRITRGKVIETEMRKLQKSKNTEDINLFNLIMDFDRWNAHRILPLEIQEPSAYKRRNKHKNRKLVKLASNLNPFAIEKIRELYSVKKIKDDEEFYYVPILRQGDLDNSEVMIIRPKHLSKMVDLILFVFDKEKDAERYVDITKIYLEKDYKHCRDGQIFWPEYRLLTLRALNYTELQNITPNRKALDLASKDLDMILYRNQNKKKNMN